MNWRIITLAVAALLAWGCEPEATPAPRAELTVPASASSAALSVRPAEPLARTTEKVEKVAPTEAVHHHPHPMEGVTSAFPWGKGENGVWSGTKATDPEPLKEISDADMLKRAMGEAPEQIDREHALVSVGRRRLPGAMDAFTKALGHSEPLAVREMALSGLIEHGGPDALPLMWQALRDDPSEQLRGMAIWAVALYGETEARKAIDAGLADEDMGVRGMAILAVWALKDQPEVALSLLESAAQSDEKRIYQEALYTLSRMPWPRAARILSQHALGTQSDKQRTAVHYYRTWIRAFPDLKR
jgi:hypothetical protein